METRLEWVPSSSNLGVLIMFGRFRKQFVDFKTMNQHLKYCYNNRQILFRAKEKNETIKKAVLDLINAVE